MLACALAGALVTAGNADRSPVAPAVPVGTAVVAPGGYGEPSTDGFALAGPLQVHAVDPAGRSVSGVRVAAKWLSGLPVHFGHGNPNWVPVTTDGSGLANFEGLPATAVLLEVDGAGWSWTDRIRVDLSPGAGRKVSIALAPAVSLSGRVVTAEGRPAAGFRLTAERGASDGTHGLERWWGYSGECDAEGRFAIDGIRPGRYLVTLEAPSDLSARHEAVVETPASGLVLRLPPTTGGEVLVESTPELQARVRTLSVELLGRTARGRHVEVEASRVQLAVPPGEYLIHGTTWLRNPWTMFSWSGRLSVVGGRSTRWTIVRPEGAAIEGRVLTSDGSPRARGMVSARRQNAPFLELRSPPDDVAVNTNEAGYFRIEGLEAGAPYDVSVDAYPDRFLRTTAVPGGRPLSLKLEPARRIQFTPRDPQGRSVAALEIQGLVRVSEHGGFNVDRSVFETSTLTLWSREGLGGKRIALPDRGGTLELRDVVLEPPRRLSGTVVDARTGLPVARALVERLQDSGLAPDDLSYDDRAGFYVYGEDVPGSARTDARGTFTVETSPSIPIRVSAPGFLARTLAGDFPGGEVALERSPVVNVTVSAARAPTCIELEGRASIANVLSPRILTDPQGRGRITELQPGRLRLRRGCPYQAGPWTTVDVRAGQTVDVKLE
jgi:hypothetical protein